MVTLHQHPIIVLQLLRVQLVSAVSVVHHSALAGQARQGCSVSTTAHARGTHGLQVLFQVLDVSLLRVNMHTGV